MVFTSDVLTEDLEITGPLTATIYFESDREDTDIIVHLCDVYPDGKSLLISEGGLRTGIHCFNATETIEKPHKFEIDLWATSIVFAKGHAIRVSISSSNFPRYEKNMNMGLLHGPSGKGTVAKNKVFVGNKHRSHITLPVVKHAPTTDRPSTSSNTDES